MTNFELIKHWNEVAGVTPPSPPNCESSLAIELIKEEVIELLYAVHVNDMVEVADALGDILVVVYGACVRFGLDADFIVREVMASNFSKFCTDEEEAKASVEAYAADGVESYYKQEKHLYIIHRKSDNKILKSIKFFKPDFKSLMKGE